MLGCALCSQSLSVFVVFIFLEGGGVFGSHSVALRAFS